MGPRIAGEAGADPVLARPGKSLATTVGILNAARRIIDTINTENIQTQNNIATSLNMASQTPTLDLFVAAIHELREAVADSKYDVTTARERLALTKGVNFDSQLVEKVRGIITDIDKELHTTSDSLSNASTEDEKRMFMLQTMDYVEGKAFGKGESKESPPSEKDLAASILSDKESETKVGGSSTSQGKGENIKLSSSEVANGEDMSKEASTLVEGATTDNGKENQIKPALNGVVTDQGMSKEENTLVEDANTDKGKEKQIEPVVDGPKKKKRKPRKKKKQRPTDQSMNDIGNSEQDEDFVGPSTLDKGKGKESELPIEGSATDQGRNDEIGLPPAETEVQGERNIEVGLPPAETEVQGEENDYNELFVTQETKDLTQEAIDADLGPISDRDSGITFRIGEPEPTGPHPPLYVSHADAIMSIRKMHALLKLAIRPQIATPYQLDLFCRFVGDPVLFSKMREIIGELKWNR